MRDEDDRRATDAFSGKRTQHTQISCPRGRGSFSVVGGVQSETPTMLVRLTAPGETARHSFLQRTEQALPEYAAKPRACISIYRPGAGLRPAQSSAVEEL